MLDAPIYVFTPVGEYIIVTHVYHVCSVQFMNFWTWIDLTILDMIDFDVFLEITW